MHNMGRLYKFQQEGVRWLVENPLAYLADKPGLGKTVQAIVAATELGVRRPTVLCPAIAREVWRSHWLEWGLPGVELQTFSYDWIASHGEHHQHIWHTSDLIIGDEWHYTKNPLAKRARAACRIVNRARRVWLLSGTPIPNNPSEIYTTLRAVWPHLLRELGTPTYRDFIAKFCISEPVRFGHGRTGTRIIGAQNSAQLRDVLSKIMLVRTAEEVDLQLPPLRWENTRLDLSHEEWEDLTDMLAPIATPAVVKEINDRLLHNQPLPGDSLAELRRVLGVQKAVPAVRLLAEELENGAYKKIVVVAYHREVLGVLEDGLKRFGLVRTDGSTSDPQRTSNINSFQHDPSVRIYLGQYGTTGTAITLHAAHELVLVEQPWGPGEIEQISRRIHRIGQDRSCRVRMFIIPDTLDDAVARVRARKLRMIGEVVTT